MGKRDATGKMPRPAGGVKPNSKGGTTVRTGADKRWTPKRVK